MIDSIFLTLLTVVTLAIVAYQDIKSRQVHLLLLILIGVLNLTAATKPEGWLEFVTTNAIPNLSFIVVQFLAILLYLRVVHKTGWRNVWDHFGPGDLILWIGLTPLFDFPIFCIHFVASLVCAFLVHNLLRLLPAQTNSSVPLAGFQSIYIIVVVISENIP